MSRLSHIWANCNDFDCVFYDDREIPDYNSHFDFTFAVTICGIFPEELDHESATKLAKDVYAKYGDSVTGLMEWADKRGLQSETFRQDFFKAYHRNLLSHFKQVAPHIFAEQSKLVKLFGQLDRIVRNGIATHGCADEWVRPVLRTMGLTPYIQDNAIFGLAESGFRKKSTHPDLVRKCMEALEIQEDEMAYPEDTARNLKQNKEMMPKLTTILITNGRPLDSKPSYIDYEFNSFEEYLRALHIAHTAPPKLIMI